MKFALIVPALNEEQAIAGTLRRCLAAREKITSQTAVEKMYVVFVNDGSTDGTQAVVDQPEFNDVVKVRFEKNRGYGAAIKAGFKATDADLVGFIDGDGTCDPEFCVKLINELNAANADVTLAARLQPDTEMPMIRQIGNKIFAKLLGFMAGASLTDTASGFRVIKRSSLKLMTPLPDRLHYTPAMSAICMLDPRLKIVEVHGMKYKEREGRSKLNVLKDGFRFLFTIMFAACCYSPVKTMAGFSVIAAVLLALLGLIGSADWGTIGIVGGAVISVLMYAGVIVHQLNFLLIGPRAAAGPAERALHSIMHHRTLLNLGGIVCAIGGVGLLFFKQVASLGYWGLWLTIMLCLWGSLLGVAGVMVRVIWAVGEKTQALVKDEYAMPCNPVNNGNGSRHAEAKQAGNNGAPAVSAH